MNTEISFEESIRTLERHKSQRAFQEGYAAYLAGVDRTNIPNHLGVFCGNWVEGWMAAAADAEQQPGKKPAIPVTGHIPLFQSATTVLTPHAVTLN